MELLNLLITDIKRILGCKENKTMMYDEKFLKSFIERVEATYLGISKITKYDTTILLCSLTGILSVIDNNVRKNIFSDIAIPDYIKAVGKTSNSSCHTHKTIDNDKKNLAIIRHFRNSLCHFKLDEKHIFADKNGNIEKIIFEDYYDGDLNFQCTLNIKEIEKFMLFLIEKIKGS